MSPYEIKEIKIPRDTVSDNAVLILQWHADSGSRIKKGDLIVSLETSKTAFDIEAPEDGYLFYKHKKGEQAPVGGLLAVVSQKESFSFDSYASGRAPHQTKGPRFSKSALRLIEEQGLDKNMFSEKGMVTEKQVLQQLRPAAGNCRILILGGGGHAKMCIDILNQMKAYEIAGIIDDKLEACSEILGVPLIGRTDDLPGLYKGGIRLIVNGLGMVTNHPMREGLFVKLKEIGFQLPNLIHPRAVVEPSAVLGEGNQIMANATVGSAVKIHNNCIINSGSVVSHDSLLYDNVHVAPGAVLAGGVHVGKNTLIGMGTTVYLKVKIGEGVLIYNGCHITKDIPDGKQIMNDTDTHRVQPTKDG